MLKIIEISSNSAEVIYKIQKKSFESLLNKYKDYDINPVMESVELIRNKIDRADTKGYIFQLYGINVGWVRVTSLKDRTYKISALSVI